MSEIKCHFCNSEDVVYIDDEYLADETIYT
jgi:hypothetical protein